MKQMHESCLLLAEVFPGNEVVFHIVSDGFFQ
jgi:hypothetical protein